MPTGMSSKEIHNRRGAGSGKERRKEEVFSVTIQLLRIKLNGLVAQMVRALC